MGDDTSEAEVLVAIERLRHHELQQLCKHFDLSTRGTTATLRAAVKKAALAELAAGKAQESDGGGSSSGTSSGTSRAKRRRSGGGSSSRSPSPAVPGRSALQSARRVSRDTSLAYLVPALTAAVLQLEHWERRSAGFAAAALFALVHHAYELEHGKMMPLLNRIDIFFAVSAAVIEITAVPPTAPRAVGAAIAAGSWLYQKLCVQPGGPEQIHAHVVWHVVSSAVAAVLMATGA
jgi:hypothetical protein